MNKEDLINKILEDDYADLLKEILEDDPDFINKIGDRAHNSYVKENKYIPPGLLSKEKTIKALSDIFVSLCGIKNSLSRGDRIYYDVGGIISKAKDEIQELIDQVYNDD